MGGGARPTGWCDLVDRGCIALCAAAIMLSGAAFAAPAPHPAAASPQAPQQPAKHAVRHARHGVRLAKLHAHASVRRSSEDGEEHDRASGMSERLNRSTIAVVGGEIGSTDLAILRDLSDVLDDGDNLRILAVAGASGARNIRDVRFLKGVDLAITQTNVLARVDASRELGPLGDKLVYVAKLFNAELHVLVRADGNITGIGELGGRPVSLGPAGSGSEAIGHDVLTRLGIAAREINLPAAEAIARLKAGDIDAVLLLDGKPMPALADASGGLRLLAVPFAKPLRDDFLPATLTGADYPGLIEPGRAVETLAVGTVLVANNRHDDPDHSAKIKKFVEAFFPRLAQLQAAPHHPKWREVNLAATLPGWTRVSAAQEWLAAYRDAEAALHDAGGPFASARGVVAAPGRR